jgi:hypothetical protein
LNEAEQYFENEDDII